MPSAQAAPFPVAPETTLLSQVPPTQGQSELLITEPASIRQPGTPPANQPAAPNADTLKNVANSIQTKPAPTTIAIPGLPDNLIPKDLLRTGGRTRSDSNPIEFFQVPPPPPSLGINLNQIR